MREAYQLILDGLVARGWSPPRRPVRVSRLREERHLTMVIVTHSNEVAQAADRRISMKDGQVQPV